MANHAAIDIGTNSVHLLVAAVGEDGDFSVLTTDKETVRLGDSPGDIRLLRTDAIDRGVNALHRFKAIADSFSLRRTALIYQIPYYTTLSGATAAVQAISALRSGQLEVAPLQSYFRGSF